MLVLFFLLNYVQHCSHRLSLQKYIQKVDMTLGYASSRALSGFSRVAARRLLSTEGKESGKQTEAVKEVVKEAAKVQENGWWTSATFWGGLGAMAGWGMSGAAIYDASLQGPEVISLNMTGVLIVYSSLFARWAFVVKPQNMLLAACHVANICAQSNQMRRAMEHKIATGREQEVKDMASTAAMVGAVGAGAILAGPMMRSALGNANLGIVSTFAAADAGPFTVHFWAPMSKWMISGASFMDLSRPTEKISLPQYTALTFTGLFFTRYALLISPINYNLCAVNAALFGSSAWHLSRKVYADYFLKDE